jgi:iron complex outermembrane receptor protein
MMPHKLSIRICTSLIAIAVAVPAVAQTAPAPAPAPDAVTSSGSYLDDIVVTARKRSESLQNVPASILAVGEAQINALNAKSLAELNGVTPNVDLRDDGTLTIRGISSNARNIGFEAGAAVYMDGVYQGRPLGNNQDLADVARIEFLRGPQGTLYGKNTTAGAISIVTVRPGDTWTGKGEVQYAENNDLRVGGYVAGPIVPGQVGIKLSAFRRKSDGYQVNLFSGERTGYKNAIGGRAELRFTPGTWDIAMRGDYTDDKSTPDNQEPVSGFALAFSPGLDTLSEDKSVGLRVKGGGASLTIDKQLGGGYSLTSITGWRTLDQLLTNFDDDFSPLDIAFHRFVDHGRQFSQEIRLTSPSSGKFNYIIGGYYFRQSLNSNRPVTLSTGFPIQGLVSNIVTTTTDTLAAFANADYHFTDRLTLNVGLRYTSDHKTLDFVQLGIPLLGYPFFDFTDKFTESDLSPTASLLYKFSPAVTGYAKFSKGFKSGGWNPDLTATPNIRFKAENVNNYELGLRTRLLDGRLTFNVTGYYMDYNNLQVAQFLGTFSGFVITNAGSARIKGIEAEFQAKPASWLSFSGGGAYNDAKYTRFDSGVGNYAGQQFTRAPKFTAFASADVKVPVGFGDFILHGDARYQGKVFFDDARTVKPVGFYGEKEYVITNARIGFALNNGIEVTAFVQNLTNRRILLDRQSDALQLGLVLDRYGPPRQFGGRASFRF